MRMFIILFLFLAQLSYSQTELVIERVEGLTSNDRIEEIVIVNDDVWIASRAGIYKYDNTSNDLSQVYNNPDALAVNVSRNGTV